MRRFMRQRSKGVIATFVLSALLVPMAASAGSLDSPGAPSSGSNMPTLQGIYNQLDTGATSTPAASFQEPAAGPTAGTGRSLSEIKLKLPVPDNTIGASPADVLSGRTFWGLRTDGTWGVKSGTMPNNGAANFTPGAMAVSVPAGYYNGGQLLTTLKP